LNARSHHSAIMLPNNKLLILGGTNDATLGMTSVEIYDVSLNSWASSSALSDPRYSFSSILLQDGKILVSKGTHNALNSSFWEILEP
jgi:Galactose oxidase, central domain